MAKDIFVPPDQKALAAQAEAAKPQSELDVLRARVAELEGLVGKQATASAGAIIDPSFEQWKEWAALSAQQKTQLEAEKRWGSECAQRYRVSLPSNKEHPEILIPARSEEEARMRYLMICGITSINDNDPTTPRRLVCQLTQAA